VQKNLAVTPSTTERLPVSQRSVIQSRIDIRFEQLGRELGATGLATSIQLTTLPAIDFFLSQSSDPEDPIEQNFEEFVSGSYVATTATFSVGYVLWLVRGGSLLASFSSAVPLWTTLDPLAIVAIGEDEEDAEDESLIEITNTITSK